MLAIQINTSSVPVRSALLQVVSVLFYFLAPFLGDTYK